MLDAEQKKIAVASALQSFVGASGVLQLVEAKDKASGAAHQASQMVWLQPRLPFLLLRRLSFSRIRSSESSQKIQ